MKKPLKLTIICENRVYHRRGLVAEHGWAVFVESAAGNFLFDTGQGPALLRNARELGLDLGTCDAVIVSHHHWDHTGGLRDLLGLTGPVDVFAHPDLFKESYRLKNGVVEPTGIPFSREELEQRGARFRFGRSFCEVAEGLFLTGEIPRVTPFEKGDLSLLVRRGGETVPDPILDDQALVAVRDDGLVVLLGCSHSGVVNTLRHVREKTGLSRIRALIGGTHLGPLPEAEIERSIAALKEFDIGLIGAAHCTGEGPGRRLAEEFGDRCISCTTGDSVLI